MTPLSAWCSTAPGVPRHDAQHRVCAMRLKAGLIAACSCPDHGESSTVERDSRIQACDNRGTTKDGPGRLCANTDAASGASPTLTRSVD